MSLKINNTIAFSNSRGTVYEQGAATSDSGVPHKGAGVAVYPKVQPVDLELSEDSKNPIANCTVTAALKELTANDSTAASGAGIATKEFYTGNWHIKDAEEQNVILSHMNVNGWPRKYYWEWTSLKTNLENLDDIEKQWATETEIADWNQFIDNNYLNITSIQIIVMEYMTKCICSSFNCSLFKLNNAWFISCSSPIPEAFSLSPANLTYAWTPTAKLLYSPDFSKDENGNPNEAAQIGISHLTSLYDKLYAKIVIHYIPTQSNDTTERGNN